MQISKDMVYQLQPTISGPQLAYPDAERNSMYRGHLTYLPDVGRWVGWVEYDRVGGPGMMRAAVTKRATDLDHALRQINDRLREKQRGGRDQRSYLPIDPTLHSCEISRYETQSWLDFQDEMRQLLDG